MKYSFSMLCTFALLIASISSNAFANSLPDVSNVRAEGSRIVWDPLPGAAGYNIYSGALVGSQQGQGGFQYLTTVTGSTSYQPSEAFRILKIVGFSAGGAAFSDVRTASLAFVSVIEANSIESVDVIFYNDSIGRYLVTNVCNNTDGDCIARCDHNANVGSASGGFCSTDSDTPLSSLGTQLSYMCSTSTDSTPITVTAGVYCAP